MISDFDYEIVDNIVIIKILTNLDYQTELAFAKFLEDFVMQNCSIIFDLSLVDFINSSTLGLIIRKTRIIKCVVLSKDNKNLDNILKVVNFDKMIPVVKTMNEAINYLKKDYIE